MVTKPSRVSKINFQHSVYTLRNLPKNCEKLIKIYEEITGVSYDMAKTMEIE